MALSFGHISSAALYKCISEDGKVSFQSLPCEGVVNETEKIKVDVVRPTKPYRLTKENTRKAMLATYDDSMRFTASECKRRGSSYASEALNASTRLYEIRKDEIDEGRKILQRGIGNISPSENQRLRAKGKREHIIKLSRMTKAELDSFCSVQSKRARLLAAGAKNRSSGYMEGDIDPEGND